MQKSIKEIYKFIIDYSPQDWRVPNEIYNVTRKEAEAEALGYNKSNKAWGDLIKAAFEEYAK